MNRKDDILQQQWKEEGEVDGYHTSTKKKKTLENN